MAFRETLRNASVADLDFVNDEFEAALRANHIAVAEMELNGYLLEQKAAEMEVDIDAAAEAVIKFARLNKGNYRALSLADKQDLKNAFADLYPTGAPAEAEIETIFNNLLDASATAGDLVEIGNELLQATPPEE